MYFFLKAIGHYFIVFSSEYVFSSQNVQSNIHTDGMSIHSISKFARLGGISQNMYINNHISLYMYLYMYLLHTHTYVLEIWDNVL